MYIDVECGKLNYIISELQETAKELIEKVVKIPFDPNIMMIQGTKGHVYHACLKKHDIMSPLHIMMAVINTGVLFEMNMKYVRNYAMQRL